METVSIHGPQQSRSGRRVSLSLAALFLLLAAMAAAAYLTLSGSAFTVGGNVVIGPRYTGKVAIAPGCTAEASNGHVMLPYRRNGRNSLSVLLGFVIIPR